MRTRLLTVALLCSLILPGWAQAALHIQNWETEKGARVLFVQNDMLPMLDIRIVFDAASARDNGLPGIAMLTNGLLSEGAAGMDAQQLAEQFESVGAQFENESLRDMAIVGVRSLTDEQYLGTAISTLTAVLTKPDFPQDAFERELARMKVAVEARKQSPSELASIAFYETIYGEHPYATPSGGTEQSLAAITLEDIEAFYQRYYVASNAVIVMVGAVDRKQAEILANQVIDGLPQGTRPEALPPVPELTEAKTVKIEYPSTQSHIYVGQPGMTRDDEDYFKLYVANHPFGGSGFASRLMQSVREDRGLAYSVSSYFLPMREKGPFIMGLQTRTDQTEEALNILRDELEKYVAEGPTRDELEASLSNIVGGFALNLDSNSKLVSNLAMIGFYDLPLDYLETYIDNMRDVSRRDVKKVLKQRLDTSRLVTVIVGNSSGSQSAGK